MKTCSRCKKTKPLSEFYEFKARGGHQSYCKLCNKSSRAAYYQKKKARYRENKQKLRASLIEEMRQLKADTPCADCGNSFEHFKLEFDHREPAGKTANVSEIAASGCREKFYEEVAKCDIVCGTCHLGRTWERRQHAPQGE